MRGDLEARGRGGRGLVVRSLTAGGAASVHGGGGGGDGEGQGDITAGPDRTGVGGLAV